MFKSLPIAHLLNNEVLILHGGLFQQTDTTLDDIRKIDRFKEPPNDGIMCDALWADPDSLIPGSSASPRGVSHKFGKHITDEFCKRNGIKKIIRSHEMKMDGYEEQHDEKCVTVFSAPN